LAKRLIYLDACVFLSYINEYAGRASQVEALLIEGRKWDTDLFTSVLSTVEVAFGAMEQANAALDDETQGRIDAFWLPGSPVHLVEFYRLIGDDARSLMRLAITRGWSLKGMDAIHLATARRVEATEFATYDVTRLKKYEEDVGFAILEPEPRQPLLPEPPELSAPSPS